LHGTNLLIAEGCPLSMQEQIGKPTNTITRDCSGVKGLPET